MFRLNIFGFLTVLIVTTGLANPGYAQVRPIDTDHEFESGSVDIEHAGVKRNYSYRFHRPEGLVPNTNIPLVVFLHGAGERAPPLRPSHL